MTRPATELEAALQDYDGKHADILKELRDEFAPTAPVLRRALKLSAHDHVHIAQGATWLLWTWLTAGAKATPRLVAELAALLPRLDDKWVMLHVVRCVPLLVIAPQQAVAYMTFLQRCLAGELPFLRAWAVDSLHRLALEHDAFAGDARRAMEAGAIDPAPSVRKRVQKIMQGR
jgi:hypothetical protein